MGILSIYSHVILVVSFLSKAMEQNHLEKVLATQMKNKLHVFYGSWRFITCSQEYATGSYPGPVESSPYSFYLRFTLIVFSHLYQDLPSSLFQSDFLTIILCVFLVSLAWYIPANLILLDSITQTIFGEKYELCSFVMQPLLLLRSKYFPQPFPRKPSMF
jgi:hypothetical protein